MSIVYRNNENFMGSNSRLVMLEGNGEPINSTEKKLTKVSKSLYGDSTKRKPLVKIAVYEDIPSNKVQVTTVNSKAVEPAKVIENLLGSIMSTTMPKPRIRTGTMLRGEFAPGMDITGDEMFGRYGGGQSHNFHQGMHIQMPSIKKVQKRLVKLADQLENDSEFRENFYKRAAYQKSLEEQPEQENVEGNEDVTVVSPAVMAYIKKYVDSVMKKTPIGISNPELVIYIRPYLRKQLVEEHGFISGEEFDDLNGEQLHGLFSFIGKAIKGIGKGISGVVKGIGKGVSAIGKAGLGAIKGIGKGIGAVGKLAWENLPGILSIGAGLIPGVGTLVSAGIDAVTGLTKKSDDSQGNQNNAPSDTGGGEQQQLEDIQQQMQPPRKYQLSTPTPRYAPPRYRLSTPTPRYAPENVPQPPMYYPQPPMYYPQPPMYYAQPNYYDPNEYYDDGTTDQNLPQLTPVDQQMLGNIFDDVWGKIKSAGEFLLDPTKRRTAANYLNTTSDAQTMLQEGFRSAEDRAKLEQKSKQVQYGLQTDTQSLLSTWGIPLAIGVFALVMLNKK